MRGAVQLSAVLYLVQGRLSSRRSPLLERGLSDLPGLAACRSLFARVASALGYAYALAGRVAEALPLLEQAVEQRSRLEAASASRCCSTWLGEALPAGRPSGRAQCRWPSAPWTLPASTRSAAARPGRSASSARSPPTPTRPRSSRPRAYYRQALALAEELGMRPLVAHCHLGLGTLYQKIGRDEQAQAELTTAAEMYRAMEMTFWLEKAEQ